MQVFGDVGALKRAIEKRYASKIAEVVKDKEKQLGEIGEELNKKLDLLRAHMRITIAADVKKAYSMVLSEGKTKAKRGFEEKRETLIETVLKEAQKRAKKIAHTQEYVDFVKQNMPACEGLLVTGSNEYYKKFFPRLKIDTGIAGIKVEAGSVTYDFTLDSLIASKKDVLRQEANNLLLGK